MPDTTNEDLIASLLDYLDGRLSTDHRWTDAIRGLVAERNALKQRVAKLEARAKPVYITDGQRVESIDLRERLVCAALTGILSNSDFKMDEKASASWVVAYADATLAAMRKGESDGK